MGNASRSHTSSPTAAEQSSPSLTHVPSDDEEDDEDQPTTGEHSHGPQRAPRKRSSKACDNCRKAKCKCEKSTDSTACRNCVLLGQGKAAPARGIAGNAHCVTRSAGQSLIADLIADPLARHIIARVDESPFGSRGKDSSDARDPKARTHINTARTAILNGGPSGFDVPPRDWQDELGARILGSSHSRPSSRHAPTPTPPARSPQMHSAADCPLLARSLPPNALGQLSLNEHHQLRYHGKASGLHILAQAPAYRRDRVRMDDDGIWKFPASRVWPPVAEERDSDTEPTNSINGPTESYDMLEIRVAAEVLPSREQQEKLLNLYFAYVHPVLPIIHREVFWQNWKARPPRAGTMWAAGDNYLEAAKVLLNRSYASSKASTCQALLLLSYREIGIGAMAQAWLYVGMSVRMAQDLGLHRSIDKWQAAGANTFSAAEKQTRRCIWFGCVVMDKYVSTYIGRPLAVFERDYDTRWPDQDLDEIDQDWVDIVKDDSVTAGSYEPVPGRVLECFAAASKLSAILSRIVEALYSIRPGSTPKSAERVQLEEELEKWALALPVYLRYDITRVYWRGAESVLLLHRPSILESGSISLRLLRRRTDSRPEGSTTSDQSTSTSSARAIGLCKLAANHITKIVLTYGEHFSLGRGPAFLSYYVFSASIMHVTLLMMNPEDSIMVMKDTWPSAGRAYELLNESKMNIQEHYLESLRRSPWRHKRKTPEEPDDNTERAHQRSHSRDGMREGGIQLAPMRETRPMVNLRIQPRDGTLNHASPTTAGAGPHPAPPSCHSPVPSIMQHSRSSLRHMQPTSGQAPNYAPVAPSPYSQPQQPQQQTSQSVEPMFTDPGYTRWGSEILRTTTRRTQPPPPPQQQQGQGWTTSATRFSAERGPGGSGTGNPGGGYWQDYHPSTTFGNDMSSSLYGIMPQVPGTVGIQSIFQDGATGVYQNPDGPGGMSPNYPVYSRLS
ncbi:Fungal specific transcription factor domain [Rhizoctonia solani]|uniref:Fungal specific transcription factor domain n=1 Tax=Rhizoctonia solani TaxID=456999 RepID=A0A8H8P8A5_9AGAM|nr:Fungal specific transcription factor domain [Rhizoctonia solani]QRW25643.1 Fungal specific transcription factor domain [Rhizoctonia solani]